MGIARTLENMFNFHKNHSPPGSLAFIILFVFLPFSACLMLFSFCQQIESELPFS